MFNLNMKNCFDFSLDWKDVAFKFMYKTISIIITKSRYLINNIKKTIRSAIGETLRMALT